MNARENERCGHTLDIGLDDDDVLPGEPCERPTWEDYDRCVWHADVDGKTAEMLEEADPRPGDDLDGAYLRDASLSGVDWFRGTSLVGAEFSTSNLNSADLSNADLTLATLSGVSAINTDFSDANLEGAVFTDGDLRRASLTDARLSEVVFTDIHISEKTAFGEVSVYERESVEPKLSGDDPLKAAAWAYRQLQQVYQANALPERARQAYNREKDVRRKLDWKRDEYVDAIQSEISRWVMRYGSSPYRVLGASLLVIVVSAVLFPITGGIEETRGERLVTYTLENPEQAPSWWIAEVLVKSLYFSVVTFATLGYGDIQPIGAWARALASVETILGSLLSALLVFVLTRRVTW